MAPGTTRDARPSTGRTRQRRGPSSLALALGLCAVLLLSSWPAGALLAVPEPVTAVGPRTVADALAHAARAAPQQAAQVAALQRDVATLSRSDGFGIVDAAIDVARGRAGPEYESALADLARLAHAAHGMNLTPEAVIDLAAAGSGAALPPAAADRAKRALAAERAAASQDPRALALALALTEVPAPRSAVVTAPVFATAGDAVAALQDFYGVAAAPAPRLGPEGERAFVQIVAAHLTLAHAVRVAAATPGGDVGLLVAARDTAARLVQKAVPALPCIPGGPVVDAGVLAYDFACESTTYASDRAVIIDAGGDDVYLNNAGGADATAALVVDAGGDDRYAIPMIDSAVVTGSGARGGAGFLWDASGNDAYDGRIRNGGVWHGSGFDGGVGFLFDGGGNDVYRAFLPHGSTHAASTGSSFAGAGFLFDAAGNDAFVASLARWGGPPSASVGAALGGSAVFVDAAGDDSYTSVGASGASIGGAAQAGVSVFIDAGDGRDVIVGVADSEGATVGGAFLAHAVFIDGGGADSVTTTGGGPGAGAADARGVRGAASSVFIDLGGADARSVFNGLGAGLAGPRVFGPSATATRACALFVDVGGDADVTQLRGVGLGAAVSRAPNVDDAAQACGFAWDDGGDNVVTGSAQLALGATEGTGTGTQVLPNERVRHAGSEARAWSVLGRGNDGVTLNSHGGLAGAASGGEGSTQSAFFVDAGGHDIMDLASPSHNGAAFGVATSGSLGAFLDLDGDDTRTRNGGNAAAGAVIGGGVGLYLDVAGNDVLTLMDAGWLLLGAATGASVAVVADGGGNDRYEVRENGIDGFHAFGAAYSLTNVPQKHQLTKLRHPFALVYDRAGNDVYAMTSASTRLTPERGQGASEGIGVGALVDGDGDDAFTVQTVRAAGVQGYAAGGLGVLVDFGGTNRFTVVDDGTGGSQGASVQGPAARLQDPVDPDVQHEAVAGGLGLLVAGPGRDTFDGRGVTQGSAAGGGVGFLSDLGGDNAYAAGPGGLAQGAGKDRGVGALTDAGNDVTMHLRAGTVGQGAGLGGVGIVARPNPFGSTTYSAAPTARPGETDGAGVGLRVDAGGAALIGARPDVSCGAAQELYRVTFGAFFDVRACSADAANKRAVRNPVTGEELGDVAKPEGLCALLTFPVDCRAVLTQLIAPSAANWVDRDHHTTTTSGGLVYFTYRGADSVPVQIGRYTQNSVDETCDMSCAVVATAA